MLNPNERELLTGKNFVHLATLNADGSPQVSPVWVDLDGDIILINTARGRVKEINLSRDPRAALSVHDQTDPYSKASIRGRVIEITETGASEHIDSLSRKYLGKAYPWHRSGEQRVIIKIQKI